MEIVRKEIDLSAPVEHINLASLRDEKVMARAKSLIVDLVQTTQQLTKKDIGKWRQAMQLAVNFENPKRYALYSIFDDNLLDDHLLGAIRNRKLKVLGKPFNLVDKKSGEVNEDATMLLKKRWFKKILSLSLDSIFWGHSLIQIGDIVNTPEGPALTDVTLVPRRHVIQEYGRLVKNMSDEWKKGSDYRKTYADWIVEVYDDVYELGLLNAVSHQCISKRNALAFWDQFSEIFGMPVRIGKTLSRDQKDIDRVTTMLEHMGTAAYGVFPEGTEIEIKETSRGDAYNVYDRRIERANTEMSKAILGQTMTMDNGSSKSQAIVHENVSDEIAEADADFLKDVINDKVIPLLVKHGFKIDNTRFEWDDTYEYTPTEMVEVEGMILQYYQVDPEYFIKKYDITILGEKAKGQDTPPPDPQKKKPQVKLSAQLDNIQTLYSPCPECGGHPITLAADDSKIEEEANRIARAIFREKKMPDKLDKKVIKRVYELLKKGLVEGYGMDLPDLDTDTADYKMLERLQKDVWQFSVAKNYTELSEITSLLVDGERVRSFSEFKAEVLKLHRLFCVDYLNTEYNTAVNGSELAARWTQFQANKEAMPLLTYETVGDDRVREAHRALDGIRKPVDDPFWDSYYPPNDWNCRCTVNQTGTGSATPDKQVKAPVIPEIFRTNLAKSGLVFPKDHPYYDGLPDNFKTMQP